MLCYTSGVFEKRVSDLSDWVVEKYPTSPGNGMIWRFIDTQGKVGKVKMASGGKSFVVTNQFDQELTRIPIGKIFIALPIVGTELFIRYILSRAWHVLAANRLRRDIIQAEWHEMNIDALSDMLQYGVVVAPRPDIRKETDE